MHPKPRYVLSPVVAACPKPKHAVNTERDQTDVQGKPSHLGHPLPRDSRYSYDLAGTTPTQ